MELILKAKIEGLGDRGDVVRVKNGYARNYLLPKNLADVSCTIVVQAGEEDKLYGSVGTHDIAEAIAKQGFGINHRQVVLEEPIKKLGVYTIPIRLHREVEVPIKVWVVKE